MCKRWEGSATGIFCFVLDMVGQALWICLFCFFLRWKTPLHKIQRTVFAGCCLFQTSPSLSCLQSGQQKGHHNMGRKEIPASHPSVALRDTTTPFEPKYSSRAAGQVRVTHPPTLPSPQNSLASRHGASCPPQGPQKRTVAATLSPQTQAPKVGNSRTCQRARSQPRLSNEPQTSATGQKHEQPQGKQELQAPKKK